MNVLNGDVEKCLGVERVLFEIVESGLLIVCDGGGDDEGLDKEERDSKGERRVVELEGEFGQVGPELEERKRLESDDVWAGVAELVVEQFVLLVEDSDCETVGFVGGEVGETDCLSSPMLHSRVLQIVAGRAHLHSVRRLLPEHAHQLLHPPALRDGVGAAGIDEEDGRCHHCLGRVD